ncbi:MAG: DUF1446 domain-containing protein [Proteobacteria bacterium]|nr:DUF1446 domain-containing protein [Pseudomonadota bacterium]
MTDKIVHIGCGAGFSGDRVDASIPVVASLAKRQGPRYLIFETLAERTLALAQKHRRKDPSHGYSPFLEAYIRPILKTCHESGIRIVSNFGAANPMGGAAKIAEIARELGCSGLKIAVVEGDDLFQCLSEEEIRNYPTIEGLEIGDNEVIAANAYLGARPIADALAQGADVVVVGRCTDPALVLGPLVHEFGWPEDDWERLSAGTMAGHLLECGGQVTGAYFADPGYKDVPDLARVGFPIAEVGSDGSLIVTKADDTGGLVSAQTVKEQLLYEIHDPANYLTADVILDISQVRVEEVGPDRVRVSGARGKPRPDTLKATVSIDGGWMGEAEMSYAGPNALKRAQLAVDVLKQRCRDIGTNCPVRFDILGTVSVHDGDGGGGGAAGDWPDDGDYRIRVASRGHDKDGIERINQEMLSLYCSGPAAGGGFRQHLTDQVQTASILVDRALLATRVRMMEVSA